MPYIQATFQTERGSMSKPSLNIPVFDADNHHRGVIDYVHVADRTKNMVRGNPAR
jgi:hypothetical protein